MKANEYKSLSEIVEQLEGCGYECEGGYLKNNTAFKVLKQFSEKEIRISDLIDKYSQGLFILNQRLEIDNSLSRKDKMGKEMRLTLETKALLLVEVIASLNEIGG